MSANTLTVFSPAGVVARSASVQRASKRLKALGFAVSIDEAAALKYQRFAGDDAARLAALHRVAKSAPRVALATRGGYGLTRLLDVIDWRLIGRSVDAGTRWVGYSDLTALHLAALAHGAAGPASATHYAAAGGMWSGPMACDDFGRDDVEGGGDDVTQACFLEAMSGELEAVGFRTEAGFDGLECAGLLWGGNLAIVMSLLGTPHWPKIKGGILFLEDVNEHPYRIERCLLQLQQAGVLGAQRAVLLGDFSGWRASPLDRGYKLKTCIAQVRAASKTPILTGLPFGHTPVKVTMPVGRRVRLGVQGRDVVVGW